MHTCRRTTARWRAVMIVPASIAAFLAFGSTSAFAASASPAVATTVHGQGGNSASAPGQLKKADDSAATTSAATTSAAASSAPAADDSHGKASAPGQLKKADEASTDSSSAGSAGAVAASTAATPSNQGSSTSVADKPGNSDHSSGNASTVGDPTKPQPPSNADQNSGGANGDCLATSNPKGPYCSTRDGSASGNGNGNGKAVGKPCAGCVGKADNKNPKGQNPNGSDHNAGYECDRNHGIGRTNPAHTGCTTTPPPPDCTTTGTCPPPNCHQTHTCPPPDCKSMGTCPPPNCHQTHTCPPPTCATTPALCPPPTCATTPALCPPPTCATNAALCPPPGGCDTTTTDCGGGCPQGQVLNGNGDCVPPACVVTATNACGHNPGCVPTAANHHCTEVEGTKHHRQPTTTPTKVLGEKVTRTPEALPFTGADSAALMMLALLALTLGALLTVAGRRRRPALAAARTTGTATRTATIRYGAHGARAARTGGDRGRGDGGRAGHAPGGDDRRNPTG